MGGGGGGELVLDGQALWPMILAYHLDMLPLGAGFVYSRPPDEDTLVTFTHG